MAYTREQQRIFDWLNSDLKLPVFAEAYSGAVDLLNSHAKGVVTFASHVGRDFLNSFANTVNGVGSGGRVKYPELTQEIQDSWNLEWGQENTGFDEKEAAAKESVIPKKVCKKINKLIVEHQEGTQRSGDVLSKFFSTFFDYRDKDRIPKEQIKELKKAKNWFQSHAHLRKENFENGAVITLNKHFKCLEGYLYIAASSQSERLRDLNDLLEETNN